MAQIAGLSWDSIEFITNTMPKNYNYNSNNNNEMLFLLCPVA